MKMIVCTVVYEGVNPYKMDLPMDYFPVTQTIDKFSEEDVNREAVCEILKVPSHIKTFDIAYPINNGSGSASVTIYNTNYRA